MVAGNTIVLFRGDPYCTYLAHSLQVTKETVLNTGSWVLVHPQQIVLSLDISIVHIVSVTQKLYEEASFTLIAATDK